MLKSSRKPPQEKSDAHGSLDAPELGRIKGWAIDPANPGARANVALSIDGKPLETLTASEFRSDLLAAGVGDGHHAFSLAIPEHLLDGKPHKVEAKISGTDKALQHSPRVTAFSQPAASANAPRTLPDSFLSGLSVVIATKNDEARLEKTLRACAQYARNLPVEFIVVQYGCADTPATAGAARNQGVAKASHELILFLGDNVTPTVPTFFEQHMNAHHMLPAKNVAVLGKITWPSLPDERVSFLMSHLQGAGEQQFGFHSLVPNTWLDWRYFYPENVSFKRSAAADWALGGYRTDATGQHLLEDAELAFRLDLKLLYYPGASVAHQNTYSVRQFIDRQIAAGISARALFANHPAAIEKLGLSQLDRLLATPKPEVAGNTDDLLRMIEGAKSWGVVIEANYRLGSQNWHADLLNAIFELSYLQGYVMGCPERQANYAAAYRYCMERFQEKLSTAAAFEVFGRFPSFTLT